MKITEEIIAFICFTWNNTSMNQISRTKLKFCTRRDFEIIEISFPNNFNSWKRENNTEKLLIDCNKYM